jgi:hypothetical protein
VYPGETHEKGERLNVQKDSCGATKPRSAHLLHKIIKQTGVNRLGEGVAIKVCGSGRDRRHNRALWGLNRLSGQRFVEALGRYSQELGGPDEMLLGDIMLQEAAIVVIRVRRKRCVPQVQHCRHNCEYSLLHKNNGYNW